MCCHASSALVWPGVEEATAKDIHIILQRVSTSSVALVVKIQTDNVVEPVGWKIQDISSLQYYLVDVNAFETWVQSQIRCVPIYLGVSFQWVRHWIQGHILAIAGVPQDVASLSSQDSNEVSLIVEMIFCYQSFCLNEAVRTGC